MPKAGIGASIVALITVGVWLTSESVNEVELWLITVDINWAGSYLLFRLLSYLYRKIKS